MKCPITGSPIPNNAERRAARNDREAHIDCPHCRNTHPLAGAAPELPYQETPNVWYYASNHNVRVVEHDRDTHYCTVTTWPRSTAARRWQQPQREPRVTVERLKEIGSMKW